jgi:hypothetical protein
VRTVFFDHLRIEADAVTFRRWPRPTRRISRTDVDRFVALKTREENSDASLVDLLPFVPGFRVRSHYLALLMKDGSSVRVPTKIEPAAQALRLNNELLAS